jgi:ABC-type nickel/cobalt efflux system permease component RcnA
VGTYTGAPMRRIIVLSLTLALSIALMAPALAGAHDGGEGWYGETNDKIVTNYGFYLIMFFPLFIFVMSMGQYLLDRRKDERKKAEKARKARADLRGGW